MEAGDTDIRPKVLHLTIQESRRICEKIDDRRDAGLEPCVICLEAITERAVAVPCNHLNFDFLCLVSWLQERSACPLCNSDVSQVQYDWRAPNDFKTYRVQSTTKQPAQTSSASSHSRQHYNRQIRNRRRVQPHIPWGRSTSIDENTAVQRRKHVYRNRLYSCHVGSNRRSQFRDFTPQQFASNEELQSRARMFIRRELRVFGFLDTDTSRLAEQHLESRARNAEFLLAYIVAILKTTDIKGSGGQAEELLQEFLGRDNAKLFLHELGAWLRSPYTSLQNWDRAVQYAEIGRY
ncbi:MAG: hypothetical protein M1820_010038 [Bogoriella megaspora]|nr:MAG: hypothetical protein M1820_010038 [Bogoriella megaspora]